MSLAKIVKQALSNHDLLPWNKEHNALVFALFLLIIFISTHLFIHLTTQKKKKKIIQNIYRYIVKNIKKRRFFLNSKRREYLATGTQGQNNSTFFPTLRKKIYHIVSFSYYFQLKGCQNWIFLFILKVANIRCFILIKMFWRRSQVLKICYNVVISEKNLNVCW